MTTEQRCSYCMSEGECQRCTHSIQNDILRVMDLLEQQIAKDDQRDEVGINNHLRAVWGFRDVLNIYFGNGCRMRAALEQQSGDANSPEPNDP